VIDEGVYRYYKLDDEGRKTPKGAILIKNQQLSILSDSQGILKHMFDEGPVDRKTEDIMKSVNRNHYALFVKEPKKKSVSKPEDAPSSEEIKSVYAELTEGNEMEKGEIANKLKAGAMGLALAASTAISPQQGMHSDLSPATQGVKEQVAKPIGKPNKEKDRILASIMDVESSNNKDRTHEAPHAHKLHGQERAYGGYGLMPLTIRETIKANPKIFKGHEQALKLMGSDLHNYMDKHPELEKLVASTHYDRLAKHFGNDPAKIGFAWINGITGTKKALKEGADINNHWHVVKIRNAYDARKKSGNK
jgi:hypothetical protein